MTVYLEDMTLGERQSLGSYNFSAEEIKAFASSFDPQYFHLDEEAAKESLYGGLCASGWHIASVYMKLMVEEMNRAAERAKARGEPILHGGPSPGFEAMNWLKPVMAGDTSTYYRTPSKARSLASRPGWSLLMEDIEAYNQDDVLVFCFTAKVFLRTSRQTAS